MRRKKKLLKLLRFEWKIINRFTYYNRAFSDLIIKQYVRIRNCMHLHVRSNCSVSKYNRALI